MNADDATERIIIGNISTSAVFLSPNCPKIVIISDTGSMNDRIAAEIPENTAAAAPVAGFLLLRSITPTVPDLYLLYHNHPLISRGERNAEYYSCFLAVVIDKP